MMHTLYTLGYRVPGAMEQVQACVRAGALLVDIRLMPQSRYDPDWRRGSLLARFGVAYHHLPALGNRHYRTPTLPMCLQDEARGLQELTQLLQRQEVLLLCGCPLPQACHRMLVCDHMRQAFPTITIVHL